MNRELQLFYVVVGLAMIALVAAFCTGLSKQHKFPCSAKYMVIYLGGVVLVEVISQYLRYHGINNHWLIVPYTAFEFFTLGLFYLDLRWSKYRKQGLPVLSGMTLYLLLPLVFRSMLDWLYMNKFMTHLALSFCAAGFMIRLLREKDTSSIQLRFAKRVNLGIFSYFSTSLLVFYALPYCIEQLGESVLLWTFNAFMMTVFYTICLVSFVQLKTEANGT